MRVCLRSGAWNHGMPHCPHATSAPGTSGSSFFFLSPSFFFAIGALTGLCWQRTNCLVCVGGQTGSGKTFTMQGTREKPGVIPVAVQQLFDSAASSSSIETFRVKVPDLAAPGNSNIYFT